MRRVLTSVLAAFLLIVVASLPAAAADQSEWHRLNPGSSLETSEHERLICVETATTIACHYDKVQEPGLSWNRTTGRFSGRDITASWECPDWFPSEICDNVVSVHRGLAVYTPHDGPAILALQDYVVVDTGGMLVLWQYWVDQFVCPWYGTFEEALAANPTAEFDCTFAP
jgi:hypothetical protein